MKTEYVEFKLETVLNHFAKSFKPVKGLKIVAHDTPLVDVTRGVVAFKIYTEQVWIKTKKGKN